MFGFKWERWLATYNRLEDYMANNQGQLPKQLEERKLHDWYTGELKKLRQYELNSAKEGVTETETQRDLLATKRDLLQKIGLVPGMTNDRLFPQFRGIKKWQHYITDWKSEVSESEKEQLTALKGLYSHWNQEGSRLSIHEPHDSLKECMVRSLKAGDIDPSECVDTDPITGMPSSRHENVYDIRYNLSYLIMPYDPKGRSTYKPDDAYGDSTFFAANNPIISKESRDLMNEVKAEIPLVTQYFVSLGSNMHQVYVF